MKKKLIKKIKKFISEKKIYKGKKFHKEKKNS